ncbi:M3 family oligoendopeptidase [Aquibacillus koreensis]|uniref:M3 family oligoendopeptidase n=1 Tax=Aquibacillus koreensis TaxID=279446 RepID=A0A9X3WL95_9BACI|nr:M3 family oligoendopeptidase [Aquibacillus koreensis]MCT2534357.1 M3 family oligoendopeptidase [Aquibacillus koreensis]MDC3420678.1 M3 family oligoendopeptidase [Aquibacillus koreensis]
MQKNYSQTWDLDSIFSGGSESKSFNTYIQVVGESLNKLVDSIKELDIPKHTSDVTGLENVVELLGQSMKQVSEMSAFISCLLAQDVHDKHARLLIGKRNELNARFTTGLTLLDQKLVLIPENTWRELLEQPMFEEYSFVLNERRILAKDKLPSEQEVLLNDLSIDGYHAWGEMYDTIVGRLNVEIQDQEERKVLSVGQAANELSDPIRAKRKNAFEALEKVWSQDSDLFSETLNHLAGFRLQTYKHRGWDHVLSEPLRYNRMSERTLHAMWEAITNNKAPFVSYLKRKAELIGVDKLSWYDLEAPISTSTKKISYDEAARMIVEQFSLFSTKMASFAHKAFDQRWIEAEDRPGKRPGGFCTSFPDSKQTRIFMTYAGSSSSVATLAHELGHGYHQHVMDELGALNQNYAMNVAETASTFAEMIIADAAVRNASNDEEKVALLEDKIQRSVAFFMNIHARFLFEKRFYEERKQGVVSAQRLNELMEEAQKEAYCNELETYDPTFWASKLHFHITDVPFYNFPYTFGYLFSLGIYAEAIESKEDFESSYNALLKDTGRMTVEQLAEKHLNVRLDQLDFWEKGIQLCIADVEEFLRLTEK